MAWAYQEMACKDSHGQIPCNESGLRNKPLQSVKAREQSVNSLQRVKALQSVKAREQMPCKAAHEEMRCRGKHNYGHTQIQQAYAALQASWTDKALTPEDKAKVLNPKP